MAKKVLRSHLELSGIAPNLLLKDVEITCPYLFNGEINLEGEQRAYLAKLCFSKKNLNSLKYLNLSDYFYLCLSAHWATAGSYVPTNVDNQIREGLWKHKEVSGHIEKMARMTIDSWKWDYEEVTQRKTYDPQNGLILSTHEGTWLSVAIGAYNALKRHKKVQLADEMAHTILAEIRKEEKILIELHERRDHLNFLRSCALMAHNFGDLDRVIDQWNQNEKDSFQESIYKLGHQLNSSFSPILVFSGEVNKKILSVENHRHMSLRQAKCLRRSKKFLVPIGPFMDEWGGEIGRSDQLSLEEKGGIVGCFFEGYKRQDLALGYSRAFRGLINSLDGGLEELAPYIPYDVVAQIKNSQFYQRSQVQREDFEMSYSQQLNDFSCPQSGFSF